MIVYVKQQKNSAKENKGFSNHFIEITHGHKLKKAQQTTTILSKIFIPSVFGLNIVIGNSSVKILYFCLRDPMTLST